MRPVPPTEPPGGARDLIASGPGPHQVGEFALDDRCQRPSEAGQHVRRIAVDQRSADHREAPIAVAEDGVRSIVLTRASSHSVRGLRGRVAGRPRPGAGPRTRDRRAARPVDRALDARRRLADSFGVSRITMMCLTVGGSAFHASCSPRSRSRAGSAPSRDDALAARELGDEQRLDLRVVLEPANTSASTRCSAERSGSGRSRRAFVSGQLAWPMWTPRQPNSRAHGSSATRHMPAWLSPTSAMVAVASPRLRPNSQTCLPSISPTFAGRVRQRAGRDRDAGRRRGAGFGFVHGFAGSREAAPKQRGVRRAPPSRRSRPSRVSVATCEAPPALMASTTAVVEAATAYVQALRRRVRKRAVRAGSSISSFDSQASRIVSMRIVTFVEVWSPCPRTIGARISSGQCQR